MVMTMYLAIVARVLIIDQNVFSQVLQEINIPQFLDKLLDVWISKMPLVTQPEKRKLLSINQIVLLYCTKYLILFFSRRLSASQFVNSSERTDLRTI